MDFCQWLAKASWLKRKTSIEIKLRMGVKTNIIKTIDKKRLQWYGHVPRMNMSSISQLLMNWKPERKNKRGRPKKKSKDKLMRDLLGMKQMKKILRQKEMEAKAERCFRLKGNLLYKDKKKDFFLRIGICSKTLRNKFY